MSVQKIRACDYFLIGTRYRPAVFGVRQPRRRSIFSLRKTFLSNKLEVSLSQDLSKVRLDFSKLAWKPIDFFTYLESPLKTDEGTSRGDTKLLNSDYSYLVDPSEY